MRQLALLALLWLLATATATGVGLAAIHTVGDVIRGTGPVGPVYESSRPLPELSPAQAERSTLRLPAATLVVQCTGRTAELISIRPAAGWRIGEIERGPDEDVDVALRRGRSTSWVEVLLQRRFTAGGAVLRSGLAAGPG